jgi:hypothetical protein
MKRDFVSTFIFFFVIISTSVSAQNRYKATIVTKMNYSETGYVKVLLNDDNSEMLEITPAGVKNKNRNAGAGYKLNIALISYIEIDSVKYYFRDVEYGYNNKMHMNVLARLVKGNLDCGLFRQGNTNDNDHIFIKLPNKDYSRLVATEFDYYLATSGWTIMAFSECKSLIAKISKGEPGYKWDDNTGKEARLAMWMNLIDEYSKCND